MKEFLFVFAAIVACAMALDEDLQKRLCSIEATGTATTPTLSGLPVHMIRVRDTARYDIGGGLFSLSFITRPDLSSSFYFTSISGNNNCGDMYAISLSDYMDSGEEDAYAIWGYDPQTQTDYIKSAIYFNGDSLVKEYFRFSDTLNVTITYTNVNYDYKHDQIDNAFSFTEEQCSNIAMALTNASQARTSLMCGFVDMPSNFCSLTANGTLTMISTDFIVDASKHVKMTRVKDYVRYDIYDDSEHTKFNSSYILRPDIGYSFFYMPKNPDESTFEKCYSYSESINLLFYSYKETTEDGLDVFTERAKALYFNHSNGFIAREEFQIKDGYYQRYEIYINYTSWDYGYVHDEDDNETFSLKYDKCPDEAWSETKYAISSLQCSEAKFVQSAFPCAFEVEVDIAGEVNYTQKVMYKNSNFFYTSVATAHYRYLIRGDITDGKGNWYCSDYDFEYEKNESGYCQEYYSSLMEGHLRALLGSFEYRGEPVSVTCPDNSAGCLRYCDYDPEYNSCYYFKNGAPVLVGDTAFTYKSTVPTLEDFEGEFCNGTALPTPEDFCHQPDPSSGTPVTPSSSSKVPATSSSKAPATSSSKVPATSSKAASTVESASFSIPSILIAVVAMFVALF